MAKTPMDIKRRPFSVEPITNIMLPDGIFDTAIFTQKITCHYTNTADIDLVDVTIYLESVGDPGIVAVPHSFFFPKCVRVLRFALSGRPIFATARQVKSSLASSRKRRTWIPNG